MDAGPTPVPRAERAAIGVGARWRGGSMQKAARVQQVPRRIAPVARVAVTAHHHLVAVGLGELHGAVAVLIAVLGASVKALPAHFASWTGYQSVQLRLLDGVGDFGANEPAWQVDF